MSVRFAIAGWTACAPGLEGPADWEAWARAPFPPQGDPGAKLDAMPAMQRRRLNGLGRAAVQAAWTVHEPAPDVPVVFASRYGDAERCLNLLRTFAAAGEASPTDFTFSVHNAIAGMYSIARGDGAASTSIAAGAGTAACAVVEACAQLADGAREVLLVCYDAPVPGEYAAFADEPAATYAWAWRIVAAQPDAPHIELTWTSDAAARSADLPFGLEVLRFAVSGATQARLGDGATAWTWSRHA